MKTIEDINEKIESGKAVVLTAREFKERVRKKKTRAEDVDVVTTATCGLMSGTAAILSIPITRGGKFERADEVWINDVPAFPGPCPNERLGIVDVIVYGTARSESKPQEYGGGHLFRELVEGKRVEVKVKADGKVFRKKVTISELGFAKLLTTRSSFRNYMGFLNTKKGKVKSIFSVMGLRGPYEEISVSGCGEINPLENDPHLQTIGVGTKVLVNGAVGYVLSKGTRSSVQRPNLSVVADMHGMSPELMGGFVTSSGPECVTSIAIPIPVLDEKIFSNLEKTDEEVGLPIADIHDRVPFTESDYGKVWKNTDLKIRFNPRKCQEHEVCEVQKYCPTKAFRKGEGIDESKCFNCGVCVRLCPNGAFEGNLGRIEIGGKEIPITLRQSNRERAEELASMLKRMIIRRKFLLANPVARLE